MRKKIIKIGIVLLIISFIMFLSSTYIWSNAKDNGDNLTEEISNIFAFIFFLLFLVISPVIVVIGLVLKGEPLQILKKSSARNNEIRYPHPSLITPRNGRQKRKFFDYPKINLVNIPKAMGISAIITIPTGLLFYIGLNSIYSNLEGFENFAVILSLQLLVSFFVILTVVISMHWGYKRKKGK